MKTLTILALTLMALFLVTAPVLAQEGTPTGTYALSGAGFGAGIGAGLTILGAALGFGRIGSSALDSMARQPEVAGRIQTAMIIIGALLEGATFFALIVCIQVAGRVGV